MTIALLLACRSSVHPFINAYVSAKVGYQTGFIFGRYVHCGTPLILIKYMHATYNTTCPSPWSGISSDLSHFNVGDDEPCIIVTFNIQHDFPLKPPIKFYQQYSRMLVVEIVWVYTLWVPEQNYETIEVKLSTFEFSTDTQQLRSCQNSQ